MYSEYFIEIKALKPMIDIVYKMVMQFKIVALRMLLNLLTTNLGEIPNKSMPFFVPYVTFYLQHIFLHIIIQ